MTGYHQGNGGQEQPHQVWNASQPVVGSGADQDVKSTSHINPGQHAIPPQQLDQAAAINTFFPIGMMLYPALQPNDNSDLGPGTNTSYYDISGDNLAHTPPTTTDGGDIRGHGLTIAGYDTTSDNVGNIIPTGGSNGVYTADYTGAARGVDGYNPGTSTAGSHSSYNRGHNMAYIGRGNNTGQNPSTTPRNPFYTTYTGPDLAARIGLDIITAIANRATNPPSDYDITTGSTPADDGGNTHNGCNAGEDPGNMP